MKIPKKIKFYISLALLLLYPVICYTQGIKPSFDHVVNTMIVFLFIDSLRPNNYKDKYFKLVSLLSGLVEATNMSKTQKAKFRSALNVIATGKSNNQS